MVMDGSPSTGLNHRVRQTRAVESGLSLPEPKSCVIVGCTALQTLQTATLGGWSFDTAFLFRYCKPLLW